MFRFRYFGSFGNFGSFGTETSLPKHQKSNNFGRKYNFHRNIFRCLGNKYLLVEHYLACRGRIGQDSGAMSNRTFIGIISGQVNPRSFSRRPNTEWIEFRSVTWAYTPQGGTSGARQYLVYLLWFRTRIKCHANSARFAATQQVDRQAAGHRSKGQGN